MHERGEVYAAVDAADGQGVDAGEARLVFEHVPHEVGSAQRDVPHRDLPERRLRRGEVEDVEKVDVCAHVVVPEVEVDLHERRRHAAHDRQGMRAKRRRAQALEGGEADEGLPEVRATEPQELFGTANVEVLKACRRAEDCDEHLLLWPGFGLHPHVVLLRVAGLVPARLRLPLLAVRRRIDVVQEQILVAVVPVVPIENPEVDRDGELAEVGRAAVEVRHHEVAERQEGVVILDLDPERKDVSGSEGVQNPAGAGQRHYICLVMENVEDREEDVETER